MGSRHHFGGFSTWVPNVILDVFWEGSRRNLGCDLDGFPTWVPDVILDVIGEGSRRGFQTSFWMGFGRFRHGFRMLFWLRFGRVPEVGSGHHFGCDLEWFPT